MSQPKDAALAKTMEPIVALCKRRGFIFPSSDIYGGINGFWDYGPLGVELKRNLKAAWWHDVVRCSPDGPDGNPIEMVGLDSTIIMNPKVWQASGHVGGFHDPMVDCRETKNRYRLDHLFVYKPKDDSDDATMFAFVQGEPDSAIRQIRKRVGKNVDLDRYRISPLCQIPVYEFEYVIAPQASQPGTLTEPRQFNLMFKTYVGAIENQEAMTYLRPETAQGIFANFRNVVDTSRVKVPFGIAQVGKAFRNEVTPRNFTFRSREFEQMEIEFFIHPDAAGRWYEYWRDCRYKWWQSIGLTGQNLLLRQHDPDELAHYAKDGAGTSDIEYRFPFTAPGFGELEGIAHRTDFDLRQHAEHSGLGDKFKYFDQENNQRFFPHVIEPSAGVDRGALALLCQAYTPDESRASKVYMKFHPRMAPIKAAVFPLVNKDGMPEIAARLYQSLRSKLAVQFDVKQSIGKRYARMDEAGTPYCFTIDGQTPSDQTVTVRHRDTLEQERIGIDNRRCLLSPKSWGL